LLHISSKYAKIQRLKDAVLKQVLMKINKAGNKQKNLKEIFCYAFESLFQLFIS